MKRKIIFLLLPMLFIGSLVSACASPVFRAENNGPVQIFGYGFLEINGSNYQSNQITYNLKVENLNDQGFTVRLVSENKLNDYFSDPPVFVPANSKSTIPLTVWVGGQTIYGKINVNFECEDGTPQFIFPSFDLTIYGQKIEAPPISSCSSFNLDGCYSGFQRSYFCLSRQLSYIQTCTKSCCEQFGGKGSFCTNDRQSCISLNKMPVGTEGNIAMLCSKPDCNYGIERNVWFLLRYTGWNVTGKQYDQWTEDELKKYDFMVCTDESKACNIKFNSQIYNAHVNGVPLLEIPNSRSLQAAYSFGYITKNQASSSSNPLNVTSSDYITNGYNGIVDVINGNSFVTVNKQFLSLGVVGLADAGSKGDSTLFKAKETYGHGRYAFVGWFTKAGVTDLKTDGGIILNRTLKWLKSGDVAFGGTNFNQPKLGNIAFICAAKDCSKKSEMSLIKFFRNNGYTVSGKVENSWNATLLSNYDFMACSDSYKGCKITNGSSVYNAHKLGGKGFLDLSDSARLNAAYIFGYVSRVYGSAQTSLQLTNVSNDNMFTGLSNPLNVTVKRISVNGVSINYLLSTDVAHPVPPNKYLKPISTILKSDATSTKGRYAFVGWASSPELLTSDGMKLLLRITAWVKCGNSCI